jgi:hypothetical protein
MSAFQKGSAVCVIPNAEGRRDIPRLGRYDSLESYEESPGFFLEPVLK